MGRSNNEEQININKELRSKQVYDILKKRIIEDQIKPGDKLSTASIAEELGISRSPVAVALSSLERDNYVVVMPQYGTFVRELNYEELDVVYRARAALERIIVEAVVAKVDKERLSYFKQRFLEFNNIDSFEYDSIKDLFQVDVDFHSFLAEYFPKIISNEFRNICDLTMRSRFLNLEYEIKTGNAELIKEKNIEMHVSIIDAIFAGDTEQAAELAVKDVMYTRSSVLKFLYGIGQTDI